MFTTFSRMFTRQAPQRWRLLCLMLVMHLAACEHTVKNTKYFAADSGVKACGMCPDVSRPICDERTQQCVACLTDTDCSTQGDAGKATCELGANSADNTCVE